MKTSLCKACKKEITWAKTEKGATIPLDRVKPIYRVEEGEGGFPKAVKVEGAYISHFATCTDPGRFSGKGRKDPRKE